MQGIYTALISPFTQNNELDLAAFKRILRDQAEAGVAGVIPCGTTGESPTLSMEEKKTLIQTALTELSGSGVKVLAGTGTNDTAKTVEFSVWAAKQGVDALLVVTPYYNKPSQVGLEAHYLAVANAVSCEVIPYNVPGRTGVSLTPETIVKLVQHPRIKTVKEATGNVTLTSEILDQAVLNGRPVDVLSGDDATYLASLSIGAVGAISVASNLIPRAMVAIQKGGLHPTSREIHKKYFPLFRDLFLEANPIGIKQAMADVGWCSETLRLPLTPLSNVNKEKLRATLDRCGIVKGKLL